MGTTEAPFATPEAPHRPPGQRSSHHAERDLVGFTDWRALAGFTGAVWAMGQRLQPLSPLERGRRLGSGAGRIADAGRYPGRTRLGDPFCGWEHRARPPACCRSKKSTPTAEALGRSQGGFSTKIHVRCEGKGKPITFLLTPGQQHEITVAERLLEQGAIRRGNGHLRIRPKRVAGDKGYAFRKYRQYLHRRGIRTTIPRKKNEHQTGPFDRELYRQRNQMERLINRLKQFRRVATRYDKLASSYAAMLTVAMILLWL
jgi:transposase